MIKTSTAAKKLQAQFPDISGIEARGNDEIFLGNVCEGGLIDGLPAANYYSEDYKEVIYIMNTHRKLHDALYELGFFAEFHDPGTMSAYRS